MVQALSPALGGHLDRPCTGLETLLPSPGSRATAPQAWVALQAPVTGGRSPGGPTAWPGRPAGARRRSQGRARGHGRSRPCVSRLRHGAWDTSRAAQAAGREVGHWVSASPCSALGEPSETRALGPRGKPCDSSSDRPGRTRRCFPRLQRPGEEGSRTWFEEGAKVRQRLAACWDSFSETERIFGLETSLSAADEAPLCSLSAKGKKPLTHCRIDHEIGCQERFRVRVISLTAEAAN